MFLPTADLDGLLQAAPAEGRVLEEPIVEGDGDALLLFLAPGASLLFMPRAQCDVHGSDLSCPCAARKISADRFRVE